MGNPQSGVIASEFRSTASLLHTSGKFFQTVAQAPSAERSLLRTVGWHVLSSVEVSYVHSCQSSSATWHQICSRTLCGLLGRMLESPATEGKRTGLRFASSAIVSPHHSAH